MLAGELIVVDSDAFYMRDASGLLRLSSVITMTRNVCFTSVLHLSCFHSFKGGAGRENRNVITASINTIPIIVGA